MPDHPDERFGHGVRPSAPLIAPLAFLKINRAAAIRSASRSLFLTTLVVHPDEREAGGPTLGKLKLAKATDMVEKTKEEERRGKGRRRINTAAWADPGGILPVIDCKIIDFSDDGAKIAVQAGIELPDVFALQIDNSRILGEAQVMWRTETAVGVKLVRRI